VTAAAEKIQSRMEELPESFRRQVLDCAKRFKSSWVELGRMLSEVKREALWRDWGYAGFDAYCAKELFIRKSTAEKLTMSYGFIERHEPGLARGQEPRPAPAFEVIEVLSRAEASGRLPETGWQDLREEVLERPTTPAALSRQLNEKYGPPPRPEPAGEADRLKRLAAMAHRLASGCASDDAVPRAVAERARALAEDLDELVAA
jgi:hypothetical protein